MPQKGVEGRSGAQHSEQTNRNLSKRLNGQMARGQPGEDLARPLERDVSLHKPLGVLQRWPQFYQKGHVGSKGIPKRHSFFTKTGKETKLL